MIFTSWTFLAIFLPLALGGFWASSLAGPKVAGLWLIVASLTFYGFWAPYLIVLITCSILFNYGLSVAIRRYRDRPKLQLWLMIAGVVVDLSALFYYKYLGAIVAFVLGQQFYTAHGLASIVLPLGISFFTFTQIGYLVDCREGSTHDNKFIDYVLFVTFFPHLIAGPLLHNGEMMPQFSDRKTYGYHGPNVAAGLTIFLIGMMKKSLIADPLSPLIAPGFAHPEALQIFGAWAAALGYSIQLYFDFSGYSDMAIGLALLFNVRFPANFNSPYKARNIIDFWQRWHMTLTRYLTQYLYNPIALAIRRRRMARGLPMSRKALGAPVPFITLVIFPTVATMALAGIWHGAGLQFLVFGVLHGVYLAINHAWRMYGAKPPKTPRARPARWGIAASQWFLTYLAVLVAQVFFRASSIAKAVVLLGGMAGGRGLEHPFPIPHAVPFSHLIFGRLIRHGDVIVGDSNLLQPFIYVAIGFAIVLLCPNTQQIMAEAKPILGAQPKPAPKPLLWRPSVQWALVMAVAGNVALLSLGGTTEFLYFQF
jgi:D-alanyl-lipoteichoic acid acyltransferase DltB (MBOAT superfamily)